MNSPTPFLPHINLLQISDTQTGTEGAESGETAVGGGSGGRAVGVSHGKLNLATFKCIGNELTLSLIEFVLHSLFGD